MNSVDKIKIIKESGLFAELNDSVVNSIAQIANVFNYQPGEVLIHQGAEETGAYIIANGLVKVYKLTAEGKVINLDVVGSGEIVGEMSLFNREIRSATVEAVQETQVLAIQKQDFIRLLDISSQAAAELLSVLVERLIKNHQKLHSICFKDLGQRVLETLTVLANHFPQREIVLSHQELAQIAGATRPRVTEVLNELQEQGKVKLSRGSITLRQE